MIYLFSFLVCLFLSFSFWKIGDKYKIFDRATSDPLKIHKKSVSCLGGLAMILTMIIISWFKGIDYNAIVIIIGAVLFFCLGFADDLKWRDKAKIRPFYKFLFLVLFSVLTGLIILTAGIKFQFFPILIIEAVLTFSYIFVMVNAINYQDGVDGLASGLAIISLLGFSILGLNTFYLIAVILGFLVFNFPPAKIFMGDSGAYFLGFILAVYAISFSQPYNFPSIIAPAFVLGLPLFDGVFTNIRRLFNKKSIFLGDRKHLYDRIMHKGFSTRKTIFVCYLLHSILVLMGLLIYG